MKKRRLLLICFFTGWMLALQAQTQLGITIDGEAAEDNSGSSVSMPDPNTVAIGAYGNDGGGDYAGHVRVYSLNGSNWVQKGTDINGSSANDYSGYSVSMPDANTVAIGAWGNDDAGIDAGHVRIYSWNGSNWVQKGWDILGEASGDWSGYFVSMPDENTVAIGAPKNNGSASLAGQVRIYSWNGIDDWEQKGTDIDGEGMYDRSGGALSMPDNNTVAIGAYKNSEAGNNSGQVRVYNWSGSDWVQKGIDLDGELESWFGYSVSMPDANTLAVGANAHDEIATDAGEVRIYSWTGSSWVQKGTDLNGDAFGDNFGSSVSMPDANTIAISVVQNDDIANNSGQVRVYGWNGSSWIQKGINMNGEVAYDWLGWSVSMPDANTVAMGAREGGNGPGYIQVYSYGSVGITEEAELVASLVVYPNPSNSVFNVRFGELQDVVTVRVLNISGVLVSEQQFYQTDFLEIDFQEAKGTYLIEFENKDGVFITKRIVRN